MITELVERPLMFQSNRDEAEVTLPPLSLVKVSVTVTPPTAPASVGFTTVGATSLAASNWAVKIAVSALAVEVIARITQAIAIATRSSEITDFFMGWPP
jgi:hypothetical protein